MRAVAVRAQHVDAAEAREELLRVAARSSSAYHRPRRDRRERLRARALGLRPRRYAKG